MHGNIPKGLAKPVNIRFADGARGGGMQKPRSGALESPALERPRRRVQASTPSNAPPPPTRSRSGSISDHFDGRRSLQRQRPVPGARLRDAPNRDERPPLPALHRDAPGISSRPPLSRERQQPLARRGRRELSEARSQDLLPPPPPPLPLGRRKGEPPPLLRSPRRDMDGPPPPPLRRRGGTAVRSRSPRPMASRARSDDFDERPLRGGAGATRNRGMGLPPPPPQLRHSARDEAFSCSPSPSPRFAYGHAQASSGARLPPERLREDRIEQRERNSRDLQAAVESAAAAATKSGRLDADLRNRVDALASRLRLRNQGVGKVEQDPAPLSSMRATSCVESSYSEGSYSPDVVRLSGQAVGYRPLPVHGRAPLPAGGSSRMQDRGVRTHRDGQHTGLQRQHSGRRQVGAYAPGGR